MGVGTATKKADICPNINLAVLSYLGTAERG
jgi:hypothetical protein